MSTNTGADRRLDTDRRVSSAGNGSPGRARRLATVAIIVTAAATVVWWLTLGSAADDETTPVTEPAERSLAEVQRTDLSETTEYDGTIGRLPGDEVIVRIGGTVTALPEEGVTLGQGEAVAWIDNRPIVLLFGELPAWRSMSEDTEGPDVAQLETALTALGFNEDETRMTVDDTYTGATGSVVEDWQASIGASEDGVVDLGEVLFEPGPLVVDALGVEAGHVINAGDTIFTTSSGEIQVTFDVPTTDQDLVDVGTPVTITLPDGDTTEGTISEVATTATVSTDTNQATYEVTVDLADPTVAEGIDEAPITVEAVTDGVDDVLAVPIEALLALTEGGYAVEVETDGDIALVPVEPGFYAGGLIEVVGDLQPGDQVVVP